MRPTPEKYHKVALQKVIKLTLIESVDAINANDTRCSMEEKQRARKKNT